MIYISDIMSIHSDISSKLAGMPAGTPFRSSSLIGEWPRSAVDKALSRLVLCDKISRIGRGIYVTLSQSELPVENTARDLLIEKAASLPLSGTNFDVLVNPHIASCAFTSQVPSSTLRHQYTSATVKRSLSILGSSVNIRRTSTRKIPPSSDRVGMAIVAIWEIHGSNRADQLMKIGNGLTSEELATLTNAGSHIPGWAYKMLRNKIVTKEVSIPAQNTDKPNGRIAPPPKSKQTSMAWTKSTPEGRWCGFGPYYAMFPVEFARKIIQQHCPERGTIIDPFCGRGTVPFVAMATNRLAYASDINPVGWIFSQVKIDPCPDKDQVLARAREVLLSINDTDRLSANEFQEWAWTPEVLSFLNAARRMLQWRTNIVDRTLMATLLVHLHAKVGDGLSNQMRQSKAMAPEYSVAWWKKRNSLPPSIDIIKFLESKLAWRYAKGIVSSKRLKPIIELGDSREVLGGLSENIKADLIFTSPPYCGITNYRYDNWIRLWMLGEPPWPVGSSKQRYSNKLEYTTMLHEVFTACATHAKKTASIYVRTDAREFTLNTTIEVLKKIWPSKKMYLIHDGFKKATQTALFGDDAPKPGEVDILLQGRNKPIPKGFVDLSTFIKQKSSDGKKR